MEEADSKVDLPDEILFNIFDRLALVELGKAELGKAWSFIVIIFQLILTNLFFLVCKHWRKVIQFMWSTKTMIRFERKCMLNMFTL